MAVLMFDDTAPGPLRTAAAVPDVVFSTADRDAVPAERAPCGLQRRRKYLKSSSARMLPVPWGVAGSVSRGKVQSIS